MKVKDAANCEVTDKFQKMMKALSSLSRLFFLSKKGSNHVHSATSNGPHASGSGPPGLAASGAGSLAGTGV